MQNASQTPISPGMSELVIRRGLQEPDTSASFVPHKPQRPEKSDCGLPFCIVSGCEPAGDQPQAIADLVAATKEGEQTQVLLGVTGSGKTFTMAKVIEALQRPALILAPSAVLIPPGHGAALCVPAAPCRGFWERPFD